MLTEADFLEAAKELQVPVAAIKAVAKVEAPRGGFLDSGEPAILFERHHFSRRTNRRYDLKHPQISNRRAGGYRGKQAEHERLQEAARLDRKAALMSTSWGKFQILGSNHVQAGFVRLQEFINAMYDSEQAHLKAFVSFIKNDKRLLTALRALDFTTFARIYNGPGYAENEYDTRMAEAYREG